MLELLKKNLLVGAGLASMTTSKLKEIGDKLVKESKLTEKEGEKFLKDLMKQAKDARDSMEKQVKDAVDNTMKKIKTPCEANFKKLEKEIIELRKEIEKLEKKVK